MGNCVIILRGCSIHTSNREILVLCGIDNGWIFHLINQYCTHIRLAYNLEHFCWPIIPLMGICDENMVRLVEFHTDISISITDGQYSCL